MPHFTILSSRSMRQSLIAAFSYATLTAVYAASPFLLPEQFDIDARTTSISIESGLTGDSFYVPNRNFKTDFNVTIPDGTSKNVPANAELKKFSILETDVSQSGTYTIQTSNTALIPTRYALMDGQWLRVMPTRPMSGMKDSPKKEERKDEHKKDESAKLDGNKPEPSKRMGVSEDQLPAGTTIFVSNSLNKALTYVTKGAPSKLPVFTGKGFEVIPVTHPSEAYVTDGFEIEARMDGKPVSGVTFNVYRGVSGYDKQSQRERPDVVTDAQGHAKVTFEQPGVYLLATTYPTVSRDRSIQPPAQTVSLGLTIEVAP